MRHWLFHLKILLTGSKKQLAAGVTPGDNLAVITIGYAK